MTNIFHLSVYGLVALAALMLAVAEEIALPTALTIPISLFAYFVTEKLRRFRLQTLWANLLGLSAFAIAGVELYAAGANGEAALEQRVLAGSHLLTYLTWIGLFQAKQGRQYWWLLALSVMQVAVGAILTQSGLFGALLLLYVFLALWTLSVFSLYLARYSFERAGIEMSDLNSEVETSPNSTVAVTDAVTVERAAGVGLTMPHHRTDACRNAIQLDPTENWINLRFVGGVVTTSLMSLGVGLMFFMLIPRLWVNSNAEAGGSDSQSVRTVTGFSDEVQLGEIGQILESNAPVFQVRCFVEPSGDEIDVERAAMELGYSEPLFRGSVMGRYEQGRWFAIAQDARVQSLSAPRDSIEPMDRAIRQHFILKSGMTGTRTLFGMHAIRGADTGNGLIVPDIELTSAILLRPESSTITPEIEYALFSGAPRDPAMRPMILAPRMGRFQRQQALYELQKEPEGVPRLVALAKRLARDASQNVATGLPSDRDIARAIESHLRDSGEYGYTLNAAVTDPLIDPVEDFLFNRKKGHCEYFASAMALMLRSVQIPSRLVSGFKGGEKNNYSGAFVVEGRHAHSWVEGWVDRRWQTFDPTPFYEREESVQEVGAGRSVFSEMQEMFTGMWQQRVVRISIEQQQQNVYRPLAAALKQRLDELTRPMGSVGQSIRMFLTNPTRWFSPTTWIATAALLVVLSLIRSLFRRLFPEQRSLLTRLLSLLTAAFEWVKHRRSHHRVEFYSRYLKLLSRRGLKTGLSQTPEEFAEQTVEQLAGLLNPAQLIDAPRIVTSHYYRVRYGGHSLSESEASDVNTLLTQLESALR
jgi:protein-glutamine gamma-glutamyltransferase